MLAYVIRRLLVLIPTLLMITAIVFTIISLTPGDPVAFMLGPNASETQVLQIRHLLGLDQPIWTRYIDWLWQAIRGDFGVSLRSGAPVMPTLLARVPATVELMVGGMTVALTVGIPVGVISATRRNTMFDLVVRVAALFGIAMPSFWLALIAILVFAFYLPILPPSGSGGLDHLVLPSVTLGSALAGIIMRLTRSSVLQVFGQDFIRTARAKGLTERIVIYRHALRNALLPIVTIIGLQIGTLLGGTVVIETVFAWPGLGFFTYQSLLQRDFPVIMGSLLLYASCYLLINLGTDLLYAVLDPRIRLGGRA
ncbi:MAG TPA: peptide ABC transporter [Chloroflexi bacterium]|nr:peptide ABC transporter [Chloroflexota bacterium]